MIMEDQRIREILIEKDGRFRELFIEHQEFEQRLDTMCEKGLNTPEELIVERELKKRKLQVKDAMQHLINAYRTRISPSRERS